MYEETGGNRWGTGRGRSLIHHYVSRYVAATYTLRILNRHRGDTRRWRSIVGPKRSRTRGTRSLDASGGRRSAYPMPTINTDVTAYRIALARADSTCSSYIALTIRTHRVRNAPGCAWNLHSEPSYTIRGSTLRCGPPQYAVVDWMRPSPACKEVHFGKAE